MIYSQNEIINGSFEVAGGGGADVFAWWLESAGATGSSIEAETAIVYEGLASCKMTRVGATPPSITQNIEVVPGQARRFTFWVRGDGVVSMFYRIYDQTNAADIVAQTSAGVTAETWTQKTVDITVPAGCYTIWIRFLSASTGGSSYVDDVRSWAPHSRLPVICGFGDTYETMVEFPPYDAEVPHGAGVSVGSRIILPGGNSYDWGRSEILPIPPARDITVTGEWVAADDAEMAQISFRLNGLLNVRSKLWREFGDGNTHWRWARCVGVTGEINARENLYYADYVFDFECDAGPWNGADRTRTWTLVSTVNPATIICRNAGNAPVRAVKMTVTAGSADMTTQIGVSHRVVRNAVAVNGVTSWVVRGTIGTGLELEIDNGAGTILLDGVDDYANMVFDEGYQMTPDWFYLEPGRNAYAFTWEGSGSGSTVKMEYHDGWY